MRPYRVEYFPPPQERQRSSRALPAGAEWVAPHLWRLGVRAARPRGPAPVRGVDVECLSVACAVAVRCNRCGWRSRVAWERAELLARAPAGGSGLQRAMEMDARRAFGAPAVEHHREAVHLIAALAARGALLEMKLHRPGRPYVPGFAGHVRTTRASVAVVGNNWRTLATVEVAGPEEVAPAVERASREGRWRMETIPSDSLDKIARRFAWRRIE